MAIGQRLQKVFESDCQALNRCRVTHFFVAAVTNHVLSVACCAKRVKRQLCAGQVGVVQ